MMCLLKRRLCLSNFSTVKIDMTKMYHHILVPSITLDIDYASKNEFTRKEWRKAVNCSFTISKKLTIKSVFDSCFEENNKSLAESFMTFIESEEESLLPLAKAFYLKILTTNPNYYMSYVLLYNEMKQHCQEWPEAWSIAKQNKKVATFYDRCNVNLAMSKNLAIKHIANKEGVLAHVQNSITTDFHSAKKWNIIFSCIDNEKNMSTRNQCFKLVLQNLSKSDLSLKLFQFKDIQNYLMKNGIAYKFPKILNNKPCPNCGESLSFSTITRKDVEELKTKFENEVAIGDNIYYRTTPEEWLHFKNFLQTTGKVDVVIDGLNVRPTFENKLQSLSNMKKIIIGRADQEVQTRNLSKLFRDSAYIFKTMRESIDDTFAIYAALYSGLGTKLITGDYMVNHRSAFTSNESKQKFLIWQRYHQIVACRNLDMLSLYENKIQFSAENRYHVPVYQPSPLYNEGHWMCFSMKDIP